jgi:hypothetical protein
MDAMSDVMLRRVFFILSTVIPPMVCSPNSVISVSEGMGFLSLIATGVTLMYGWKA